MPKWRDNLKRDMDDKPILACTVSGAYGGDLLVNHEVASELVKLGIVVKTRILGHFELMDEMESKLWAHLRNR